MKAAQINSYGGKEVLQTVDDAPRPPLASDQVMVEVCAAAVNPFDYKVREGNLKDSVPLAFPATLGGDLAGIVAEIGADVTSFEVGQEVYGQANALSGHGSYAEFSPVKAESLAQKPASVDFVTAAALPLAACSAYQALVDHIGLKSGQKVLIHGGAGGIGSYAVELAKHLGAHVATTVAGADVNFVKDLGADEVIDYETQKFTELLSDYDAVFDTTGTDSFDQSFDILKPGAVAVSMVAKPDEEHAKQRGITALTQSSKVTTERLAKLADMIDAGALKVNIDRTFSLDEASEALAYIQEGKHKGKVVIKVK